ncbi:MAG: NTP transferase domain-containing protein, partial [Bacteroidales bacterium]|nr:NTP transferase domain-containing protein [Bacteroidales bacterium]
MSCKYNNYLCDMKALVFAAGLGTRLGDLTRDMPKALVPVGGEPMLGRVLRKLKAAGFCDVVVTACYKADMIERWLAETRGGMPGAATRGAACGDVGGAAGGAGMNIALSVEPGPEPFETGGGIKFARPLLEGDEPFLVHNVDILSDADLAAFAAGCGELSPQLPTARSLSTANPLATLLVTDPRPQDYRFFLFRPADMRLMGWTNTRTGEVRGFVRGVDGADSATGDAPGGLAGNSKENAPSVAELRKMSFTGIHMISPAIFPLLESWPDRFSITDFYVETASRMAYEPDCPAIYGIPAPGLH